MDQQSSSFEELLKQARAGDEAAIGQLLQGNRPYLLLIANQDLDTSVKPKVAASDVVQESMFSAHQAFEQFQGDSEAELRAWLRAILHNDMRHAKRSFKGTKKREVGRERSLQVDSNVETGLVDPHATPGTNALQLEKSAQLEAAIVELPEDYQTVLRLHTFENQTFEQVGEKMSRSADAARKLWARAIYRLQKTLASKKILE